MTVTVTAPLTAPVVSLSLVSGGTLDANTTYYVKATAQTNSSFFSIPSQFRSSPSSAEVSITTGAVNRSIKVDWSAITGAGAYQVYYTKTSGVYTAAAKCRATTGDFVASVGSGATVTYTITSPTGYASWDLFASDLPLPQGMTKDLGSLMVSFTGTTTLQDIKTAIDAAGYSGHCFYDGNTFMLRGGIYQNAGVASALTAYKTELIFVHGYLVNNNANTTIKLGNFNTTYSYAYDGCRINFVKPGTFQLYTNDKIYGCFFNFRCGQSSLVMYGQIETATWGPYGSTIVANLPTIDFCNLMETSFSSVKSFSDLVVSNQYNPVSVNANGASADIIASNVTIRGGGSCQAGIVLNNNYAIYLRNWDVNVQAATTGGPETFQITVSGANKSLYMDDCIFSLTGGSWGNPAGVPSFWWRTMSGSNWPALYLRYSYTVTVQDKHGNKIIGASIAIQDAAGVAISDSPLTTDANGQATAYLTRYEILPLLAGYAAANTQTLTLKTPHTITISKSGYITKTLRYTMDRKREEIEVLENRREA